VRLFVSLPLPAAARAHLAAALAGVRTTDVAQWHVTLAFLGEVGRREPLLPGLAAAAAGVPPLTLRVRGGGSFPGVLWAGLDGDLTTLHRLADGVRQACRDAGSHVDRRPFRPHVTVARRGRAPDRLARYEGPAWTAREVHLVRSRLGASAVHAGPS
jgi:2'-5' RNA ligase